MQIEPKIASHKKPASEIRSHFASRRTSSGERRYAPTHEGSSEVRATTPHRTPAPAGPESTPMASPNDVEEAVKRLNSHKGVIGMLIINNDGIPIKTTLVTLT